MCIDVYRLCERLLCERLPSFPAPDRNLIILVEERTLIRHCLEICLRSSYEGVGVLSFFDMAGLFGAALDATKLAFVLYDIHDRRVSDPDIEQDLSQAKQALPSVPLVLLSHQQSADQITDALRQGARGYVPTSASLDILVGATRIVCAGGTFVPATSLIDDMAARTNKESLRADHFTRRQLDVLRCVRRGKANKTVARELEISESSVKAHVCNLMRKLKATNRTQLVLLTKDLFAGDSAAELGWDPKGVHAGAYDAQRFGNTNGAVEFPMRARM